VLHVDHCVTLDWRYWHRHDLLVRYSIHTSYSEMRLLMNQARGSAKKYLFAPTRPNYGGSRWWYGCPKCDRRVSRLYKPVNEHCFFCPTLQENLHSPMPLFAAI